MIVHEGKIVRASKKAEAVYDFNTLKADSAGKKISTLLDALIDEVRKENDTVDPALLGRNQGRIAAYEQLKGYLETDLSRFNLTKA